MKTSLSFCCCLLLFINCTITKDQPVSIILIQIWVRIMMMLSYYFAVCFCADEGKVNILATIASTKYDNVAAVPNVFNTFYFKSQHIPSLFLKVRRLIFTSMQPLVMIQSLRIIRMQSTAIKMLL